MGWLKGSFPPHEAYLERAGMYHIAGAYLQAREDAQAAADTADALAQVRGTLRGLILCAHAGYVVYFIPWVSAPLELPHWLECQTQS